MPYPALNLAPFSRWTLRDKAAPVTSTLGFHVDADRQLCGYRRLALILE